MASSTGSRSSKPHALAVPLPFQGHIHPLLQLSKRLVSAGFMVTFANTQACHKLIQGSSNQRSQQEGGGDGGSEIEEDGDLHFVSLEEGIAAELDDVFDVLVEVFKPGMRSAVADLLARLCEKDPPVTLLVFDFRLVFLLDVAAEVGIPSLSFWPQSAASFACNFAVFQGFQLPPGMGFDHGDRVCMFVPTQKVAIGSICEVDPNAYCSGVLIGDGNVSVVVTKCI